MMCACALAPDSIAAVPCRLCALAPLPLPLPSAAPAWRSERAHQLLHMSGDTARLEAWAVEFMPNGSKLSQVGAAGEAARKAADMCACSRVLVCVSLEGCSQCSQQPARLRRLLFVAQVMADGGGNITVLAYDKAVS